MGEGSTSVLYLWPCTLIISNLKAVRNLTGTKSKGRRGRQHNGEAWESGRTGLLFYLLNLCKINNSLCIGLCLAKSSKPYHYLYISLSARLSWGQQSYVGLYVSFSLHPPPFSLTHTHKQKRAGLFILLLVIWRRTKYILISRPSISNLKQAAHQPQVWHACSRLLALSADMNRKSKLWWCSGLTDMS